MSESRDTTDCENAAAFQRMRQMVMPFIRAAEPEVSGDHHLYFERHKGWMMRVTVQIGKKVVGKRIKFALKTRDREEAEKRRDVMILGLKRLGLTVRVRLQKKWSTGATRKTLNKRDEAES